MWGGKRWEKTTSNLFILPISCGFSRSSSCSHDHLSILFLPLKAVFTWKNYKSSLRRKNLTYLKMSFTSVLMLESSPGDTLDLLPDCLLLTLLKHRQLWLTLIVLANLSNLTQGSCLHRESLGKMAPLSFLSFGVYPQQSSLPISPFIFVPAIELPLWFADLYRLRWPDPNLINASYDLGANRWDTFRHVWSSLVHEWSPLRCTTVFIPSLGSSCWHGWSVETALHLGTAIEQHFLTTQTGEMGSYHRSCSDPAMSYHVGHKRRREPKKSVHFF